MATIVSKDRIKDWTGKIIGTIETDKNGDKTVRDFYGRIKGRYNKRADVTTDFYGRRIAKGDQCAMLLSM